MNTFIKIMQNEIGFDFIAPSKNYMKIYFKYPFFSDIDKQNKHFYVHYYIHELNNAMTSKHNNFNKNKLLCLSNILNNVFINDKIKETFFELFCKIQKTYHGFSKLAKMWRYRKATIKNKEDLAMNPIEESSKTIKIFQNNSFFLFRVSELINIFESSITNSEFFFAHPLDIKNPYNNMVFNVSELFYIFCAIKNSTYIMPIIIQHYFLCNFDKDKFAEEHESLLREISIKNAICKSDVDFLYSLAITIIKKNNYSKLLVIHPDFPKNKMVEIMKPLMLIYYRYLYSMIGNDERANLLDILNCKLQYFYLNNPNFGRKYIKTFKIMCPSTCKSITKTEITFNTDTSKYEDYF